MKSDDLSDGEWRIAREAGEKSAAERLHLPQVVLDIDAQPRLANNPHGFAAPVGDGPFNSFSQRNQPAQGGIGREDARGTEPWVLHDLRRTARKLMTRAGVRVEVGKQTLGHSRPSCSRALARMVQACRQHTFLPSGPVREAVERRIADLYQSRRPAPLAAAWAADSGDL